MNLEARYISDFPEEVQMRDTRTWGAQILVVYDGRLFVRRDEEAATRAETHVWEGQVMLPAPQVRENSASGGKKENEPYEHLVRRELQEELSIGGCGTIKVLDQLPIYAQYQQKEIEGNTKAVLIGLLAAVYEPTREEFEILQNNGSFTEIDEVLQRGEIDGEFSMRPAFKAALHLAKMADREGVSQQELDQWAAGYNTKIVEFALAHCAEQQIPLLQGIFAEELWPQNL